MEQRLQSLCPLDKGLLYMFSWLLTCVFCHVVCWDSCMHVCHKNQIPIHHLLPQGGPACVCLSLSPVRKKGWSVFSGQTPFGWGSAPLYWPLCGSLIELSCQQAAQSPCRVHYVIQTHSGAPREVLGSADNSTAPSSNTQSSVTSLCLSVLAWIRKTPILTIKQIHYYKRIAGQESFLETPMIPFLKRVV